MDRVQLCITKRIMVQTSLGLLQGGRLEDASAISIPPAQILTT